MAKYNQDGENHKYNDDIRLLTVTQTNLGKALGLSQQRINQLIDEGIVVRDEMSKGGRVMLFDSLQNHFLSKNVSGDSVNFWKEKGLHERAKRKLAELKVNKAKGEVYDAATVEGVLVELLTNFRNKLSGIPAKYSPQLEGKTREEIYRTLTAAVEEELAELSEGIETVDFNEDSATVEDDPPAGSQAD